MADEQIEIKEVNNNVLHYLKNNFYNEVEKYLSYTGKNTGFEELDKNLNGIIPGLYLIGAESSLGKTTFIHQIADNMASQGNDVLYFSLEQSKFELISKSLSRIALYMHKERVNQKGIMHNIEPSVTQNAINSYENTAKNMNIHEGNFETTVTTIRNEISKHIESTGNKPIVIIDYLQVIQSIDVRMSDKQKTDTNITELKRISRDLFLPVIVISSLNRDGYLKPISYESFKESGAIEYTADVLIGLQYKAIHAIQDIRKEKDSEKRALMDNAKLETPRKIELVCLKNRNGVQRFTCDLEFYSEYNYFKEIAGKQKKNVGSW
jgi:replicative DNA helicase